jgi:hypothetical protein
MSNTTAVSNNNDCDVSQSLLQRLRISGSKNNRPTKQRPLALPPFRRRTESVNTVMSLNSLTDTTPESAYPVQEETSATNTFSALNDCISPMEWLERVCPSDIVPKVLACCGPHTVAALSQTNRYWNTIVHQEKTWRVMCEELYKVRTME